MTLPYYRISSTLEGHSDDVKAVHGCSDNSILSASRDGSVKRWTMDLNEYKLEGTYVGHGAYVNSVVYNEEIISGGSDSRVLVHDLDRQDKPRETLLEHWGNVCCLSVHSETLVSGSWDLSARVWRAQKGQYEQTLRLDGHEEAVWDVKCLCDGSFLTASADKVIRRFDKSGRLIKRYQGHSEPVRSLALLNNDAFFLSASNDGTLRKWAVETGEQVCVMRGHSSFVYAVAALASPTDDDFVVSCGEDFEVRLWLGETCLQNILIPAVSIWSVTVLPNGDFAVGTSQNLVHVFTRAEERTATSVALDEWEAQSAQLKERQTGRSEERLVNEKSPVLIDIDVDDDTPNLQLKWEMGDDVNETARRFVEEHSLSPNYEDQIAQFLWQAVGGVGGVEVGQQIDSVEGAHNDAEAESESESESESEESLKPPKSNSQSESKSESPKSKTKSPIKRLAEILTSSATRRVIVMAGAGVSTGAGLPDFRSPNTGLYDNLKQYNLPYPEAVFDVDFFREQPEPFYALAKELYPGSYLPTMTHYFFRLLEVRGILKRVFTQNIDTLERVAGVSDEKMVEAHGSFVRARCIDCKVVSDGAYVKRCVIQGVIPRCQEENCSAYVKPDITFFGEALPKRFFDQLDDLGECDLLMVLGTSLEVHPFASLIGLVEKSVPRALLNLERVGERKYDGGFDFEDGSRDIFCGGKTDNVIVELAKECGWLDELMELYTTERGSKAKEFALEGALDKLRL
ncbi:hypothetical protein E3P89_02573 [Wallemia ichthyophaga]|uniref:Uncharacterized protein n=1 Tax=Wallemia ichthyophaga TaxID=245174 RepID=A0A4T0I275_WALIC|nr:hypothetical protein E3P95_00381 [Wallemia ichthyophaga]TIB04989.1 hypothetical protein E3P94_00381 [Wallemia ichthyophaga]TIB11456.1 hypothetical protein E3P93_02597 [Wallemia ichthyophaga]TIB17012.1 hypothetical protein E3P90_00195 [Wallemia ichthyophaga]TIB21522.1 hypothetical protein E3P89_02573 [Wallemia ichthyophaga]